MWENTVNAKNSKIEIEKPTLLPTMLDAEKSKETDFNSYFKQDDKPKAFVTLLFGDTASGKTYVGMTFPKPIHIIDTENRAINTKYYQFNNDPEIKIYEPVQLKTDFDPKDADALDTHATINNITKFVIDFAKQIGRAHV